jgi:cytochrome d ubiquinol oxidase subunit I
MKMAAIEAMWKTEPAPAAFTLVGIPDQAARETRYAVRIPWLIGLIGTRSLTTVIPGIEELVGRAKVRIQQGVVAFDALQKIRAAGAGAVAPEVKTAFEDNGGNLGYALLLKRYVDDPRQATPAQIDQAAWDTVPEVLPMFWTFRIMVGLSLWFVALTAIFFALSARRSLERYPLLLRLAVISIPLPWIAAECGWFVAEFGRQPWIIEGVLPTAAAVSSLGALTVLLTICGFVLIYTVLFIIEMGLMLRAIAKGPQPDTGPEAKLIPANIALAE